MGADHRLFPSLKKQHHLWAGLGPNAAALICCGLTRCRAWRDTQSQPQPMAQDTQGKQAKPARPGRGRGRPPSSHVLGAPPFLLHLLDVLDADCTASPGTEGSGFLPRWALPGDNQRLQETGVRQAERLGNGGGTPEDWGGLSELPCCSRADQQASQGRAPRGKAILHLKPLIS